MTEDPTDLLPTTRRALLHRVATGQAEGRAPSLVAGLVREGRLVWWAGRGSVDGGPPTEHTQYRIGSITKTFVAVLVMRLRDEGLVDLSAPLDTYLPGTAAGDRTVRQLLSHTAGVASETPPPWWERTPGAVRPELADVLGDAALKHPAGQRFHYSNPGFALLGALVEQVRHRPWGEVLREEVLAPLEMSRTTLLPVPPHASGWAVHPWADVVLPEPAHDAERMAPAGQLWSTVTDLARYAAFLTDGDDRILQPTTLQEMRRPAAPSEDADGSGYGLGLQLFGGPRPLVGHGGSMPGFLAGIGCSIDDRLAAVVFANATSGPLVGSVAADLISIVAEAEPRLPAAWRPLAAVDSGLLALTGPWYWGAAPLAIRLLPDRGLELVTLGSRARESRFHPQEDGTWLGLDSYYAGETLRVVRDGTGEVTHLDLGSFVLTRQPYPDSGVVPGGVDPAGWSAG
jgi:CubicO group peptidase (beta-lactamase class C family)